jgi:hypothetical protein
MKKLTNADYSQTYCESVRGRMVEVCHCVGPRNGEPLCPCKMRDVKIVDGRYVMPERDLGPVRPKSLGLLSPDELPNWLLGPSIAGRVK